MAHSDVVMGLNDYAYRSGALEATLKMARQTLALGHSEIKTPFVRQEFADRLNAIDHLLAEIDALDELRHDAAAPVTTDRSR